MRRQRAVISSARDMAAPRRMPVTAHSVSPPIMVSSMVHPSSLSAGLAHVVEKIQAVAAERGVNRIVRRGQQVAAFATQALPVGGVTALAGKALAGRHIRINSFSKFHRSCLLSCLL